MNNRDQLLKRARNFRIAAVLILVFGSAGAALLYWIRTRGPDFSGDSSMLAFDRAQRRQMEMLYGKSGALVHEWIENLKLPWTQASIILIFSILTAIGLFYFAKLLHEDAHAEESP